MEQQNLKAEQSLALIRQMIEQTRARLEEQVGRHFILMGYTTVAVALAVWLGLESTHNPAWNYLWFLIMAVYMVYGALSGWFKPAQGTRSQLDRIMGYIWLTIGLASLMLTVVAMVKPIPILFVILVIMGIGTAISGMMARFLPFTVSGLVTVLALAPATLWVGGFDQILLFAAAFVVLMVIPGHIANRRLKKSR